MGHSEKTTPAGDIIEEVIMDIVMHGDDNREEPWEWFMSGFVDDIMYNKYETCLLIIQRNTQYWSTIRLNVLMHQLKNDIVMIKTSDTIRENNHNALRWWMIQFVYSNDLFVCSYVFLTKMCSQEMHRKFLNFRWFSYHVSFCLLCPCSCVSIVCRS